MGERGSPASAGVEDGGIVDGCPAPARGCCGKRRGGIDEAGAVAGWGQAAAQDVGVRPGEKRRRSIRGVGGRHHRRNSPGAAAPFLHSPYIIRRGGAGRHSRRRQLLEFLRMCRRPRSPSRARLPRRRACPARPARMGRADHSSSTAALQLGAIPREGPSNWRLEHSPHTTNGTAKDL
jgi:hypothetical protein